MFVNCFFVETLNATFSEWNLNLSFRCEYDAAWLMDTFVIHMGSIGRIMACVFRLLQAPRVLGIVEEFHTLIGNFWKYNNWVVGHIVETHRTGTFAYHKCSLPSISSFLCGLLKEKISV